MSRKYLPVIALIALVVVIAGSAVTARAADGAQQTCPDVYSKEEGVWVRGVYCDGRLNAFDVDQPVAIYYARQPQRVIDARGHATITNAIIGIEFWVIDRNGQGQLALWVPVEDVEAAFGAASDMEIASQNGLTLRYSPSADALTAALGSYSFTWKVW
ncbi:MAG: hypothetical protein IT323_02560 [Anaerolineae bacterium]|nr:hypothetical protein [Anaerolineae bacterium]